MNSVDRQSLANTFADLLFLLLVCELASDMDCTSERRREQTRQPASSQLKCETTADHADTFDLEHSLQNGAPKTRCTASES
jgi:hypothetical protein